MRILTYNLWNHDKNFSERLELTCELIKANLVDILALQEVRDKGVVNYIKSQCGFAYAFWKKYDDCDEGLAVLSQFPIIKKESNWDGDIDTQNCGIMRTVIDANGVKLGINNLHLDYKSALNREIEIVKFVKRIEEEPCKYEILLGDFNSSPNSSIYRYLSGQQSLENHATSWIDLSESDALRKNKQSEITVDFINNPRWDEDVVLDIPSRYDWILLNNPYPNKCPKLNCVEVIGKTRTKGITASDHYGVISDLEFEY